MAFKIAFIGAGSISFTRRLLQDLLSVDEFKDIEVAFMDIDTGNLKMVTKLCQRDIEENGLKIHIFATTDRRQALKGARYVINMIRVGGMYGLKSDIEIPMKYGIDQCVGDTLCAGGIMYAQRGIPVMLDICRDIKEVCEPGCILLNYANPMAMLTWACIEHGGVQTIGLCHGVQAGHRMIAGLFNLDYREVDISCAGINHQTWFIKVSHKGEDLTGKLLEAFEKHPVYSRTEKVRIDMLRRFGYFSTESNGHLSEYLPWYRKRPEDIKDWIGFEWWSQGESAGLLRVQTENWNWFEANLENMMNEPAREYTYEGRSFEHGSYIIEALETGRVYRGHFNIRNEGTITNLPWDAIIEVPGYVDRNGLSIPKVGDLPLGCAAVCNASISAQRLAVEAAVSGDDTLLRQAMMMDPLTGAVCNPPEIWQMVDEMLVDQEQWLPQYSKVIEDAKKRLDSGELIRSKGYKGATRKEIRTVDEMRKDKEKMNKLMSTTDKAESV